ncbi:MAG: NAD-dependent epimerase/dehydratase family protein [Candidatus Burarchaeum sp.]|nr:NAD-dependent epimerase/dehydratase family protein [Candidatus Burarchaeum sp.]MDO8339238.1 NAD-dependent epimerase/dehydratase family protein [Candidatus Burarchaeum sp.]
MAFGKRALVTGATGKVGSALVKELLGRDYVVRALVRKASDAEKLPDGIENAFGDVADAASLKGCCEGVGVVFHLAALLDPAVGKEALYEVNVKGTANIVKEAASAGVKRFVYTSSIGVYGKAERGRPLRESDAPVPTDEYGASKLMGEEEVRKGGIPFAILRLGLVYGPGFVASVVPMLRMLQGRMIPYIGSGKNHIPFVHAKDVMGAFVCAGEKRGTASGTYNVVGGLVTQEEAFRLACKYLGVPAPRLHASRRFVMLGTHALNFGLGLIGRKARIRPEYLEALSLDKAFDISKAQRELGWVPKVKMEEGMSEMVEWYKKTA